MAEGARLESVLTKQCKCGWKLIFEIEVEKRLKKSNRSRYLNLSRSHMKNIFKLLFSTDFDRFRASLMEFVTSGVTLSLRKLPFISAYFGCVHKVGCNPKVSGRSAYKLNVALTNGTLKGLVFRSMNAEILRSFRKKRSIDIKRKGGRVAEGVRLESVLWVTPYEGSNPSLSAII